MNPAPPVTKALCSDAVAALTPTNLPRFVDPVLTDVCGKAVVAIDAANDPRTEVIGAPPIVGDVELPDEDDLCERLPVEPASQLPRALRKLLIQPPEHERVHD